jgi:Ca2+-binding RTX toxin-like protein
VESVTVTVTDAKGGATTSSVPVNAVQKLTLSSAPTANKTGTSSDDQFTGSLTDFNAYSAYSVVGAGGVDTLALTGANTSITGLASAIGKLDLTLTGAASLTVDTTHFGTALSAITVNAASTAAQNLSFGKINAGSTITANASVGTLTLTDINGTAGTSDAFNLTLGGGVTVTNVTGGASVIDALTINSIGSTANVVTAIGTLTTNASITATGTQALTITTLPDLGTGSFSAAAATGKITVTANSADSASITGGSAGDVISGNNGSDTISGGTGDDSITGGAGQNVLSGDAGNDLLTGGSASDTINGGDGNDVITGGGASDTLSGDAGNDSITGGSGNDTILGGDGNDTLIGGGGTDSLLGGAGNDSITGGAAAETINGGAGADTLTGGGANDTFVFAVGDSLSTSYDTITDLTKGDIIKIGAYGISGLTTATNIGTSATSATAKEVYIDSTNKFLVIETAADGSTVEKIAIQGAAASAPFKYYDNGTAADLTDDYLVVGATPLSSTVSAGKLTLVGEAGATVDVILGLSGAQVYGSAVTGGYATSIDATALSIASGAAGMSQSVTSTIASDLIITGSDLNDSLVGASGADIISGGTGSDSINGGPGADTLSGGADIDIFVYPVQADLVGSSGSTVVDSIIGGDGIDVILLGTSTIPLTITNQDTWSRVSGVETLQVNTTSGATSISLDVTAEAAGIRKVDFAASNTANSTVIDASEYVAAGLTLLAGTGSTSIVGGAGADSITGSAQSDTINGGSGADVITGGTGGSDNIDGGSGNDIITVSGSLKHTIVGGSGADSITGSTGADTITGGADNDVIYTGAGAGSDTVDGGDGDDTIIAALSSAVLAAGTGSQSIDGGAGNDIITGGDASDTINGGSGADVITGGAGSDAINGGEGADVINGGANIDTITLSALTDTYNSTTAFANGGSVAAFDKITVTTGDLINFAAIGTLADSVTVGSSLASVLTSDAINLVQGVYDTTANTFTAGSGASANDYIVQFVEATGATNAGVLLVDITGTVTLTYATEVATISFS